MSRLGARSVLLAVGDEDGTDYRDYTDDVSKVALVPVEAKDRLFGRPDYEHGGMRDYRLAMTLAQDNTTTSLWELAWTRQTDLVAFYIAPHGNLTATASRPHWTGLAWASGPDGNVVGGEANKSRNAVLVSEMTWVVHGTPERLSTGTYPTDPPEGW